MTTNAPFPFRQYGYVVLGILISIALPLLRKKLPAAFGIRSLLPAGVVSASVKIYLYVGLFSLLTAILIVAYGGSSAPTWEWCRSPIRCARHEKGFLSAWRKLFGLGSQADSSTGERCSQKK
jgi:hypothetical protein